MRSIRPAAVLASAAALALVLAGCSQEEKSAEDRWADSPLAPYFNAGYDPDQSIEEQQKELDEQNAKIEDLIAACMQKEGFDYIPNPNNGGVIGGTDDVEWEPDDREWVSQYGYGAVNSPYNDLPEEPVDEDEYVDPNQDYIDSLSESEQAAYSSTLWGEQPTDEEMEDPEFDWNSLEPGCQGNAQDEVYNSDDDPYSQEEFQPLIEAMNTFYEDMQNSSEYVELDASWASCMADAGFSGFQTQQDAAQSIYDAQNTIYEDANATYDENAPIDEETGMPEGYVDPSDSDEMKELGKKEIKVALADLDCREKTDYYDKQIDIQFAQEEEFVKAHKSELEAFKAASEQAN